MRNNAKKNIAFYLNEKRTAICLSGFFVNALASIGVDSDSLAKWVQNQVDNAPSFNPNETITRQVHGLILIALVVHNGGSFNQ